MTGVQTCALPIYFRRCPRMKFLDKLAISVGVLLSATVYLPQCFSLISFDDAKGKWMEELPHVLWTYRTTPRRSTRETPFSMTYGAEVVIPLESGFPTTRTSSFNPKDNDEQLARGLDLIEEKRENAMVQLAHYQ